MKFILGIVIGVLLIIFLVQNTQVVDITFLAWTVSISRAIMVLLVFLFGTGIGWIVTSFTVRRKLNKRRSE